MPVVRTSSIRTLALAAGLLLLALLAGSARAASSSDLTFAEFSGTTPIPSGSFASAGTGDGYDVFFDNAGHVFNVWHHNGNDGASPAVDCHTKEGVSCGAGWPFKASPLNTSMYSTGYVDNATHKLWFITDDASHSGFACLDLATIAAPAWCGGSSTTAFVPISNTKSQAGAVAVSGKLYSLNAGAELDCLDLAAGTKCGGTNPISVGTTPSGIPGLLAINDKVFGVYKEPFCYDPAASGGTGAPCAATMPTLSGSKFTVYVQPDSSGKAEGVCWAPLGDATGTPQCVAADGSTTAVTANTGLASAVMTAGKSAGTFFPQPQTSGTHVYYGDGVISGSGTLGCYDTSTNASCAGWPVSSASAYALAIDPSDPNCLWKNDHAGQISSYSSAGTPGCSAGGAVTTAFAPTLPCASGTIASWHSFALTAPVATGYKSATLTVTDAAGAVVKSNGKTWSAVPITGATRTLDLSDLAVKNTGTAPRFTVTYVGLTATGDATASLVMGVKKATGCAKTVTVASPFVASTAPSSKKKKLRIGDQTTITLKARNGSTVTSRGTKFVMKVPKGFRVVSAPGGKVKGGTITWTIGNLKSKKSAQRSVVLEAIGRGKHAIDFSVTSDNLVTGTATASTVDVLAGSAVPVTG